MVLSATQVMRDSAQICTPAQKCTLPVKKAKPAWLHTTPAPVESVALICTRLERGDLWRDIQKDLGYSYASVLAAAEQDDALRSRFMEAREARRAHWQTAVEDTGATMLAVAQAELAETTDETDTPQGRITKRSFKRSAQAAAAGAALLMPAIHGKGAGRQAPNQINVAGNAQIFGGAPTPGSLDDFDAL